MTDGILLAEIQTRPELRQYDTIIIDEAHERSLNIDFILGYLKQLLPRRPDLKVIITSATIDPERFARHFGGRRRIIEVSPAGTYPVEVRYRPLLEERDGEDDRRATATRSRRSATPSTSCSRRGPGRHPGLPLRRAGDPRHRRRARQAEPAATPRSCRCTPGCRPPSSTASSSAHRPPRSCWPPTSPRPR